MNFNTTLGEFRLTSVGDEGGEYPVPLDPSYPLPGMQTSELPTLALLVTGAVGALMQQRRRFR